MIKNLLRKAAARSKVALVETIGAALSADTAAVNRIAMGTCRKRIRIRGRDLLRAHAVVGLENHEVVGA